MNDPNRAIAQGKRRLDPPVAKRIPKDVTVHGDSRLDDYYWLRDRDHPDVLQYLEQENAYTEATLAHTRPLQKALYEELLGRVKETDQSVPERVDDYFYYTRTEAGQQYEVHCRRKDSLEAPEEVLLDENIAAEGHSYFALGTFAPSPDHRILAYSVDVNGSESFTLYLKDLETGQLLEPGIFETYYDVAWANDSRALFYTTLDATMRPYRLYRHQLGSPVASDELIHEEKDEAFFVSVEKTKSRKYIIARMGSNTTTEIRFLDADEPRSALRILRPRTHEIEHYIAHRDELFYILTNEDAKNFRLLTAPVEDPTRDNWREVIAHRDTVKLDGIEVFRNHLVVYEREEGLKKIRVIDLATGDEEYLKFGEPVYTFWAAENPEFDTDELRFNYTSLVTPRTVFDYNMATGERRLLKKYEVPGGYEPEQYESERVFAAAADGTKVPISLVYKRGLKRDGSNPLFLYGYGSYSMTVEPYFVANRLSLLDRGFVYAIAHVRGGGEMGRQWYDRGKLLNKRNTFTDFIACAEYLVERRYTSKNKIACYGGSAGGLLMGAMANMRPGLWGALIAHVPFVDVLNTMLDESLPLTVIEYEEWGNPNDKKYYEYMRSYSPYDNISRQEYPNMLVTGGFNDPRVQYWEPAKWVARLRSQKTGDNRLLLKTKMGEGHSGASGRYEYLRDVAFEFAFVLDCLGYSE